MRSLLAPALLLGLTSAASLIAGHSTESVQHGHLRANTLLSSAREGKDESNKAKKNDLFGPVIFGLMLWWLVPVCLWNNERIAIKQYKMQFKAERYAVHIDEPTREPIDDLDGHIVYIGGTSACSESLTDSAFPGVKSENKIKLRRNVQMYQWVETSREEGDENNKRTVYDYSQQWKDTPQTVSHDWSKRNPSMPMSSTKRHDGYNATMALSAGNGDDCATAAHENIRVGAYYLGDYVIRELTNWKDKDVTAEMLEEKSKGVGAWLSGLVTSDKGTPELNNDGWWYFGGNKCEIGDIRVCFEELQTGPITIVGVLTKTETGWTFVPIMSEKAAGVGDSAIVETCGSCCFRVKELHFGEEPDDDDDLKDDLKEAPCELSKKQKKAFNRSQTAAAVEEYNSDEGLEDLCCVGPFGGLVIKFMHWIGLEEEFLGVAEDDMSLSKVMRKERSDAANRHHLMRIAGLFLLCLGSYSIISPIVALLNANWIASLLGGGLISMVLILLACLCSCACFCGIVSVAWIVHRPFLASLGITSAVLFVFCLYKVLSDGHANSSPGATAAFLTVRNAVSLLMHQ